ncbi:MAG: hypothetical protein H6679_04980 [Epsilonproteobacteria bacterium]|nr:hypothetical protein [Campylobacterota bacterium]
MNFFSKATIYYLVSTILLAHTSANANTGVRAAYGLSAAASCASELYYQHNMDKKNPFGRNTIYAKITADTCALLTDISALLKAYVDDNAGKNIMTLRRTVYLLYDAKNLFADLLTIDVDDLDPDLMPEDTRRSMLDGKKLLEQLTVYAFPPLRASLQLADAHTANKNACTILQNFESVTRLLPLFLQSKYYSQDRKRLMLFLFLECVNLLWDVARIIQQEPPRPPQLTLSTLQQKVLDDLYKDASHKDQLKKHASLDADLPTKLETLADNFDLIKQIRAAATDEHTIEAKITNADQQALTKALKANTLFDKNQETLAQHKTHLEYIQKSPLFKDFLKNNVDQDEEKFTEELANLIDPDQADIDALKTAANSLKDDLEPLQDAATAINAHADLAATLNTIKTALEDTGGSDGGGDSDDDDGSDTEHRPLNERLLDYQRWKAEVENKQRTGQPLKATDVLDLHFATQATRQGLDESAVKKLEEQYFNTWLSTLSKINNVQQSPDAEKEAIETLPVPVQAVAAAERFIDAPSNASKEDETARYQYYKSKMGENKVAVVDTITKRLKYLISKTPSHKRTATRKLWVEKLAELKTKLNDNSADDQTVADLVYDALVSLMQPLLRTGGFLGGGWFTGGNNIFEEEIELARLIPESKLQKKITDLLFRLYTGQGSKTGYASINTNTSKVDQLIDLVPNSRAKDSDTKTQRAAVQEAWNNIKAGKNPDGTDRT